MSNDDHDHEDDDQGGSEIFLVLELLAEAIIAARDLALSAKIKPAALKKLAKLNRQFADAQAGLVAVKAQAAAIVAKAQADVAAIHEEAQRRLEAAAAAEQEVAQSKQKIARLESLWAPLGEPADVLSGFRSPQFSPLQKARAAFGLPAGRDPDPLNLSVDAESDAAIDALIKRDVGDERSDHLGGAFAPSTLTRSLEHKRGAV